MTKQLELTHDEWSIVVVALIMARDAWRAARGWGTEDLLPKQAVAAVCAAPDCRRLFLKRTNGRFCSERCQTRTTTRAYRKRQSV